MTPDETTVLTDEAEECRELILRGILDALEASGELFGSLPRTAHGDLPVTGLAVELSPWHGGFGLSLRSSEDFPMGESRYDSADWEHFDFTEELGLDSIERAAESVRHLYESGPPDGSEHLDRAHLAFLAAAEALLDPRVASALRAFGVDAPTIVDTFVSSPFEFVVIDPDATLASNYCDLVLATRVTDRLLRRDSAR